MTRHARKYRPRPGAILLALLVVLGLTVALGLRACSLLDDTPLSDSRLPEGGTVGSIVSLGNGRTMVAPAGSVARDVIAWLSSRTEGEHYFEAGGREFVGNSTELAPESWNRIDRFVTMLQANHDVRVRIIGFSDASGDAAEVKQLSEARARRVMNEIAAHGIARSRLSFEGRGAADPIADNATPAGRERNRRVAIILSRGRQ